MGQKKRIGPKEKKILDFLARFPNGVWKQDLIEHFSWAKRYDSVVNKRLQVMQKKGLIKIVSEVNPETGKTKQRVYLVQ
jgi:hypothetical protein